MKNEARVEEIERQKDGRLWTEMQGNLAGLLEIDEQVGNGGAGSPVRVLPTSNPLPRIAVAVA